MKDSLLRENKDSHEDPPPYSEKETHQFLENVFSFTVVKQKAGASFHILFFSSVFFSIHVFSK